MKKKNLIFLLLIFSLVVFSMLPSAAAQTGADIGESLYKFLSFIPEFEMLFGENPTTKAVFYGKFVLWIRFNARWSLL